VIFVTEAPNDRDVLELLGSLAIAVPIPHGDFAFFGKWTGGADIRICGERKKLGDLIKCMEDGRHIQQVQDARAAGFDRVFLFLEVGAVREDRVSGLIQIRKGGRWVPSVPQTTGSRLRSYLNEIELYAGVHVRRTANATDTAQEIKSLYSLFRRPPEDHSSLNKFHTPPPPAVSLYGRPSLLRRVAKELPGVGWERSKAIEDFFPSVRGLAGATAKEWSEVSGIGKKTSARIVAAINGEEEQ